MFEAVLVLAGVPLLWIVVLVVTNAAASRRASPWQRYRRPFGGYAYKLRDDDVEVAPRDFRPLPPVRDNGPGAGARYQHVPNPRNARCVCRDGKECTYETPDPGVERTRW